MKKAIILSLIFIICAVLSVIGISAEYTSLVGYHNSLEVSCTSNDECLIKNVENCCGYYPKCVHEDAELLPEVVDELCKDFDDECGSKFLIGSCSCQGESSSNKKCVGHYRTPVLNCGDGHCFEDESIEDNENYCPEDCDIEVQKIEEIKDMLEEKNITSEEEIPPEDPEEPPVVDTTADIPPVTDSQTDKGTGKTSNTPWIIIIIIVIVVVVGIVLWQVKIKRKKASTMPFE